MSASGSSLGGQSGVMNRGIKPQDKSKYIHPHQTATWQSECKEFDFVYTDLFRICAPYEFEFGTCIKQRWVGKPLIDVFSAEFPYFDDARAYYSDAMMDGRLRVNDQQADKSYLCKDGDIITHHVHRHEPPIAATPISIVHVDDDIVVVDKPSSMPVHPGGRYRRCTLVAILAKEHGMFDLSPVHRLDRLTSGVMVLAKSRDAAEVKRKEFAGEGEGGKGIMKKYLARVVGDVPKEPMIIDKPIRCKSHREAVHECHPDGKPSQTRVTLLGTVGNESLVLCEPLTGRTHQIRLHLQAISCPIGNDPVYGPKGVGSTSGQLPVVEGEASGEGYSCREEGHEGDRVGAGKRLMEREEGGGEKRQRGTACEEGHEIRELGEAMAREDSSLGLKERGWFKESCVHCRKSETEGCKGYYVPIKKQHDDSTSLLIWLHALSISGPGWAYATAFPPWALRFGSREQLAAKIDGYVEPTLGN